MCREHYQLRKLSIDGTVQELELSATVTVHLRSRPSEDLDELETHDQQTVTVR